MNPPVLAKPSEVARHRAWTALVVRIDEQRGIQRQQRIDGRRHGWQGQTGRRRRAELDLGQRRQRAALLRLGQRPVHEHTFEGSSRSPWQSVDGLMNIFPALSRLCRQFERCHTAVITTKTRCHSSEVTGVATHRDNAKPLLTGNLVSKANPIDPESAKPSSHIQEANLVSHRRVVRLRPCSCVLPQLSSLA